jgi:ATP-binding cassette subfamily C protein LapB
MLIRRPLTRILGSSMQESAQRTAHLFEVMNGVDTIKSLGAEAWARRQWEMLTVKISENSVQMREWTSFGTYISLLVTNLSSILIVMFGALMIGAGDLTMGQLIAVSMLAGRAITPATQIAALIVRYEQTRQALDALDKIMESPTDETTDSLHLPRLAGRWISATCISPTRKARRCSRASTCTIRPGERIGFIGRIGSGKSTLFKLLLNLYGPDQGTVMVDGIAVNQLEPQSLRRQVGYVPQDVVLFHGDIRENILLGGSQAGDEQLLEALRLSCLDETLDPDAQGPRHPGRRARRPPLRRPAPGGVHRPRPGPEAPHAAAGRTLQHDGPGHRGPAHRQPAQHQGHHHAAGHPPHGHAAAGRPPGRARPGPRRHGRPP